MLSDIAGRLKSREETRREYDVLAEAEDIPDDGFMPSWLYDEDFERGQEVKKKFLERFNNVPLEEAIPGKAVSNAFGECYEISASMEYRPARIEGDQARMSLLSHLRLLHGIGPEKEAKLKAEGYHSIEDLIRHPGWTKKARQFVDLLDAGDPASIQQEIWRWLPKSHPLNLYVTAYSDIERLMAIDIETLGLFSRPIILFGAAYVQGDQIRTVQYLARNIAEEASAIEEFCTAITERPIISYNGRAFDVPYVNQRRWFYDMHGEVDNIHFDMLHFARKAFKDKLPDARLITIEQHLTGNSRTDDVPGAMVPEFYEAYLKNGNPGPLVPIVEHNRLDMITLAKVFTHLCEEECSGVRR